jgi:hypothetical protein
MSAISVGALQQICQRQPVDKIDLNKAIYLACHGSLPVCTVK